MELNLGPLKFSRTRVLLWLVAVAWFTGLCWWHRNIAIDDAWITFRYARNFVEGNSFVFNTGEPLEGYSNFLWVLFSSVAISANVEPLGAVRVLGWLSVVAGFGLLIHGIPRAATITLAVPRVVLETSDSPSAGAPAELPPYSSATAALILAAAYPLAVWTMMGLETAFYAMLILALLVQLNELWRAPSILKSLLVGALLVALAMTRPEGAMWMALLLGVFLSTDRRRMSLTFALPLALFTSVFAVYTAWRFHIFGTIIPNTVAAKVGGGAGASVANGAAYLFGALGQGFLISFLLALVVVVRHLRHRGGGGLPHGNMVLICACALALQVAFTIGVGGDWMPSARFLVPALAPLCILASLAIRPWPLFVRIVILAFFFLSGFLHARDEAMLRWCRWAGKEVGGKLLTEPQRIAGDFLRVNAKPTDVLAATEAGVVPYHARLPFIDMLGLVDAHIASMPGGLHQKFDTSYVLARKPDLILLGFDVTAAGLVPKWTPDQELFASDDFQKNYAEVERWPRPMNNVKWGMQEGCMVLYRRKQQ